jgi:hypothetical protein
MLYFLNASYYKQFYQIIKVSTVSILPGFFGFADFKNKCFTLEDSSDLVAFLCLVGIWPAVIASNQ